MFSRQEAKAMRQQFWTAFGIYMRQHSSVRGPHIKWVNYRTGVRDIYFRLEADAKRAMLAIDLQHKDSGIRNLIFDQWEELQLLLHNMTGAEWIWEREFRLPNGKMIGRIYLERPGLNLFSQNDWGELFEFFATYLLPLDELWADAMDVFQDLES